MKNEKITKENNIDFSDFCLQWNLDNLNWEDYKTQKTEGNEFPPFALDVFRNALKNAMEHNNHQSLNYLVQFIEDKRTALQGETIWLEWDLAKAYHFLNQTILAKNKASALLKSKPNEYWLWDFLGDIFENNDKKMRKVFIKFDDIPTEISLPESRFSLKSHKAEQYVQLKGEFNAGKFKLFLCQETDDINQDNFFARKIAIIDNINNEKNLVHLLVSEKIDTVISKDVLNFNPLVTDVVEISLSQHTTKDGKKRYKVHHIKKANNLHLKIY